MSRRRRHTTRTGRGLTRQLPRAGRKQRGWIDLYLWLGLVTVLLVAGIPRLRPLLPLALLIGAVGGLWYLSRRNSRRAKRAPVGATPPRPKQIREILQWLDRAKYRVIHDVTLQAGPYPPQHFEHLVVGPAGIFNLVVCRLEGQVRIEPPGAWSQVTARGQVRRVESPLLQIEQQRRVLEAMAGQMVPICDVILLSKSDTVVEGAYHCPLPILTPDLLLHHIQSQAGWKVLRPKEVEGLYGRILLVCQAK